MQTDQHANPAGQGKPGPTTRRWTLAILILAVLFVLMPFLFWQATWFGRPMTDSEITKALSPSARPRDIQHALAQIDQRIRTGDSRVHQWYPQIIALAGSPVEQVRLTVAWLMGQDNRSDEFHAALRRLLDDPQPMVARNAALALVRFGDDSGHLQICDMLELWAVKAPVSGVLKARLRTGDVVNPGTKVASIQTAGGEQDVRSEVPGAIKSWSAADGDGVSAGQTLVELSPSEDMVWESLRALFLIGRRDDVPAIEQYASGAQGMPPRVAQQARLTAEAIRDRDTSPSSDSTNPR
jgi:biotin carboxyl carrier protein